MKAAAAMLAAGLVLVAAAGAARAWIKDDRNVHNFHYSTDVDGRVEEGSMEVDAKNSLESFRTGSRDGEVVEIHDFQIGITGIYFSGGGKCYIRSQIKAFHPGVEKVDRESSVFEMKDGILPVKSDDKSLIWVAAEEPLKDRSFLSSKILGLCGDRPIFWLHPTEPKAISLGRRKRRDARRSKRQYESGAHTPAPEDTSSPAVKNITAAEGTREEEDGGEASASAFNPENPYHRGHELEAGGLVFDPMLDHQGLCCMDCHRSYTHCERICEPLGGYWPWPYNYRGCRSACRIILPCRWWVARIMGIV
ncbi:leukocyte cell-derived chemotaxin 1-like isoform X2 [Denticeps clupeoides]|uniref:leukocyte cell-derived chemotaxin 1-like isoform X2 n=1 Tax=Denticeps clupeoides TaxID=299321 RepID=UPI0010A2F8E8|nr:leukocyte cell-derived chemotaxin 1-like isoform X2 [Denticeps clupeoides]